MNAPPKSIFKSKIALSQALVAIAGLLGTFFPDVGQLLATHANTILMVAGVLGIGLRLITKGRVVLFADSDK